MAAIIQTAQQMFTSIIRRMVSYTEEITYFGENSVAFALVRSIGEQALRSQSQYVSSRRRDTLMGAQGDDLIEVASEHGTGKLGPQKSRVLIVMRPFTSQVTAITGTKLELEDATQFTVGKSIRIRNEDGSVTEIATIEAVSAGTGPNGGDEIDVGLIKNTYSPTTERVDVLLRTTVAAGTLLQSLSGTLFETLEDLTVGDLNPVLNGESTNLSLSDKVWAESVNSGGDTIIEYNNITQFATPNPDVKDIFNPERSFGGEDLESDFALKYRASHALSIQAQETVAFLEALAKTGDSDVLRLFLGETSSVSSVRVLVITRNGGGLSQDRRSALEAFMNAHIRSGNRVEVRNVVPTAVEIVADITLSPGAGTAPERLRDTFGVYADRVATFLDYRKWTTGQNVDEADLISILNETDGVATVTTSTFQPQSDVEVEYLPILTRIVLTDTLSGETFGADLTPQFGASA